MSSEGDMGYNGLSPCDVDTGYGWATGEDGIIYKYDGTNWLVLADDADEQLFRVRSASVFEMT